MGIKELLSFLGGMAIGSGICYIVMKERYRKESKEEIEELKRYYEVERPSKKEAEGEVVEPKEVTVSIDAKNIGADMKDKNSYKSYTNIYNKGTVFDKVEEDADEDEDDPGYDELYPEEPVGRPYCIDEAAFVNEKSFYDKVGLFYYSGDNTIVNENDEIVTDWVELIGPDIGSRFKLQDRSDEPFSYIYIRNDSLGCDYEVALRRESYRGE